MIITETMALVASTINEGNVTMELRGLRSVQLIRPISGGVTFTRKHVHELAAKDVHCCILLDTEEKSRGIQDITKF